MMLAYLPIILAELRSELEKKPSIVAAGLFGSALTGELWEHSDIDLFIILDEEGERWEGTLLRRGGWEVHLQVLTVARLEQIMANNGGTPFFAALAGVDVWLDRTGKLTLAIEEARQFPPHARSLRALREFGEGVERLHTAEKEVAFGLESAGITLETALAQFAAAELAASGIYPPRLVWEEAHTRTLPDFEDRQALRSGEPPAEILARVWERVLTQLPERCAPLLEHIRSQGKVSGRALESDPKLGSMNLGSRLFNELVKAGLLHEVSEDYSVIGVDEIAFSVEPG